jgi:hypothetical protein
MNAINTIELQVGTLEITLLKRALSDLLETVSAQGDFYCVSPEIEHLLNQLEEIK